MRALTTAVFAGIASLASCHLLPVWEGEVNVTAMERSSIAKCGTGALTPAGVKRMSRAPYLQSTTTTSTTIVWGSTDGKGEVVLREPGGDVLQTVPAKYAGDPAQRRERLAEMRGDDRHDDDDDRDGDEDELEAEDIYLVASRFDKLEPTHLYCYQVMAGTVALTEPAPLTTAASPDATEPVRFVALGDSGTGGAAERAIMARISEHAFDLMVFLGDIAYNSGTAQQLQDKFFAIYRDFMRYVPVYPAMGNHERRTRKGAPYLEAFVLPETERYYSFDWGPVHFVAIDTTHRDAEQLVWLDKDLGANKLPWVIVFGHHPMYTNSLRGPQLWIRKAFAQILTKHKVDLVLTGHEHQYERFRVAGVNYIVSGGGGGQLTKFYGRRMALKQATVHHFLLFEVTSEALDMKALDIAGKEIEALHLTKGTGSPKVEVDGIPDPRVTPVAPEKQVVPDEKVHDEPDDDTEKPKVPPAPDKTPEKALEADPPKPVIEEKAKAPAPEKKPPAKKAKTKQKPKATAPPADNR
jgi:predicted phosphodiesterase